MIQLDPDLMSVLPKQITDFLEIYARYIHDFALQDAVEMRARMPFENACEYTRSKVRHFAHGDPFFFGDVVRAVSVHCDAKNNPPSDVESGFASIDAYLTFSKVADRFTLVARQHLFGRDLVLIRNPSEFM